ncbi:SF1B family DNA helicase RecD2, partial [Haploplasma axanthum]|uniref:ATP-dependent RecD2 DNA helicase n=1 Tax=Haploplasma axanthum TaxID=29552 RepID=A0A449BEN1_HAPAX
MSLERITAKINRYVYHNNDNSYSIVRVINENNEDLTIVGYIPILSEDIFYEFLGKWISHDKYGKQFQVETYTKSNTQSVEGVVSYLSSSYFTGIGPVTAQKIVEELGVDAIKIILSNKDILKQFNFSDSKIEKLYQQLLDNQTNEHILVNLYGYNIAGKTAMKILNFYGLLTLDKLEENPYQLINDIEGIGFIKADELAQKMGIENNDPRRIEAAVLFSMKTYSFQNGDTYLSAIDLKKYTESILGFEIDVKPVLDSLVLENEIILEEDRYYLYNSYFAENSVATELKRLKNEPSELTDYDYLSSLLEMVQIQKNIEYTELQKSAILSSLTSKVSVITGGPGTGKTTIIDGIIEIYASYFKINLSNPEIDEKIGLMAPTGRAAKRMEEVLGLPAKTIHRQLGYGYDGVFTYDADKKMPQKLIIIDESSMIDIFLARKLLEAIDSDAQVIIVGDVDQLPSVSPGTVLKDIIESKIIPVVKLTEIHRQAKNSNIIKLANAVNMQKLDMQRLESGNDLFVRNEFPNNIKKIILEQIKGALDQGYDMINDIQILIPTYKGDIGIDAINLLLQENFNDLNKPYIEYGDKKYFEKDKVIQLVNDPKNFVMNGDIGYIKRISKTVDNKDYLVVDFDGNEVFYEKNDLDSLNLAYAMSIHKSQGSEYKIVILPLIKQYTHMLKKELLYTAITRAKNYLIIIGDINLLVYAANHLSEKRKTTLKLRLQS